jgi:hypothetical protein
MNARSNLFFRQPTQLNDPLKLLFGVVTCLERQGALRSGNSRPSRNEMQQDLVWVRYRAVALMTEVADDASPEFDLLSVQWLTGKGGSPTAFGRDNDCVARIVYQTQ